MPQEMRRRFRLSAGDRVIFVVEGKRVVLRYLRSAAEVSKKRRGVPDAFRDGKEWLLGTPIKPGATEHLLPYGISSSLPAILRASISRCACGASPSGYVLAIRTFSLPSVIMPKSALVRASNS